MGLLKSLFFSSTEEDEEEMDLQEEEDSEEELIEGVDYTTEDYSYVYKKPKIYETIEGNYDKFWKDFLKEPKIVIVPGKRRSGKGVVAFNLAENIANKNKIPIYCLGGEDNGYPNFITVIDSLDSLPNDCILVVPEGGIQSNSRNSMTKESVSMSGLLSIVSHKNIWLIYCIQNSAKLDVSLIRESDCVIMMKGSLMMQEMERPVIKRLYKKYTPLISKWTEKVKGKGVCIIYSQLLKCVARWNLPNWYTEEISKSYSETEVMKK